ncbi:MAG: SBBP repeat-containing protein [Gemmataceae bacterium]
MLARFNAAGSVALYATYLGGEGNDVGQGVAIDADGYAYATGTTVPPPQRELPDHQRRLLHVLPGLASPPS